MDTCCPQGQSEYHLLEYKQLSRVCRVGMQGRSKAATSLPELLTPVLLIVLELQIIIKIMIIIVGIIFAPQ